MIIRKIKESDNPILAQIIRDTFDEYNAPRPGTVYTDPRTDNLYDLFKTPRSVLWVAEVDNEVVGSCGIFPTEGLPANCAELVKFYLKKEARGVGVGRALMEKSIQSAIEMGYKQLYLESLPQFSGAVKMYEKLGFTHLDHPMGQSGHVTCNIWMIKNLAPIS